MRETLLFNLLSKYHYDNAARWRAVIPWLDRPLIQAEFIPGAAGRVPPFHP
jgi:hypothetical protein